MTQRMVLEALKRQYLWLDGHFNELFLYASRNQDRDNLRASYLGSRRNLWAAQEKYFLDDDPTTGLLYQDLIGNQEQLERLTATGGGAKLFELISAGVGLGSRLADCGTKAAT